MTDHKIIWLDFNDAPDQRDDEALDIQSLREGLLARVDAVLLYLLPQGQIRGNKFYVGDADGHPGKSLVVELEGERRGLWKDFATEEGGDLIDLWARVRGLCIGTDFLQIVVEIRQWLGLAPPVPATPRRKRRLYLVKPCSSMINAKVTSGASERFSLE